MSISKMRLATTDGPDALDHLISAVRDIFPSEARTPQIVPEFQEIERSELVVEVGVLPGTTPKPSVSLMARQIEAGTADLEVVSTWEEDRIAVESPARYMADAVLPSGHKMLPGVAQRALTTGIPTASWEATQPWPYQGGEYPGWLLAVPVIQRDQGHGVALKARRGHLRFGLFEARRIAHSLPPAGTIGESTNHHLDR